MFRACAWGRILVTPRNEDLAMPQSKIPFQPGMSLGERFATAAPPESPLAVRILLP